MIEFLKFIVIMGTQFMSMKNSLFIFFDIYGTLAGFYPEREKIKTKIQTK